MLPPKEVASAWSAHVVVVPSKVQVPVEFTSLMVTLVTVTWAPLSGESTKRTRAKGWVKCRATPVLPYTA